MSQQRTKAREAAAGGGGTTGAVIEILRYVLEENTGSFIGSAAGTAAEASGGPSLDLEPVNTGGMTDLNFGGNALNIEGVSGNFPTPPGATMTPGSVLLDLDLNKHEILIGVEIVSPAPSVATQGIYLVAHRSGQLGAEQVSTGVIYDGVINRGMYDLLGHNKTAAAAMKAWMWLHINASEIRTLYSDVELASPFDAAAVLQWKRSIRSTDPDYGPAWTGSNLRVSIVGLTTGTAFDVAIGTIVFQRIKHESAVV